MHYNLFVSKRYEARLPISVSGKWNCTLHQICFSFCVRKRFAIFLGIDRVKAFGFWFTITVISQTADRSFRTWKVRKSLITNIESDYNHKFYGNFVVKLSQAHWRIHASVILFRCYDTQAKIFYNWHWFNTARLNAIILFLFSCSEND